MTTFDKLLDAIGLIRKSSHESAIEACKDFTRKLAASASDHGVPVLFESQAFKDKEFEEDVFIVGRNNSFIGNTIKNGATVYVGDGGNFLGCNTFFPKAK